LTIGTGNSITVLH